MRIVGLALLLLSGGCKNSGDLFECPEGEVCEDGEVLVRERATGVSVQRVALYQSVEVLMAEDGEEKSSSVPVIAGKEALMRVFLDSSSDFVSREIVGRLTLELSEEDTTVHETTFLMDGNWSEGALSSTMNFSIAADEMTPSTKFHIELLEVEAGFQGEEGLRNSVVYPQEGMASMRAQQNNGPLRVYLLPIRYNADGSGRTPSLSDSRVNEFVEDMSALYPASTIDITVLPTKDWNREVSAYGEGWGELLQEMYYERSRKSIPFDGYLYGIFNPSGSLGQYCERGCILGLSSLAQSPNDSWARISIGLGFPGNTAIGTFLHEVGHAHGRAHAPCETRDYDYSYPYSGGMIGIWGYDIYSGQLKNPNSTADFMGYCEPSWVSDYTYEALFDRIQAVSAAADVMWPEGTPRNWQTVFVEGDGNTSLGPVIQPERPPNGFVRTVRLHNGHGEVVDTTDGFFAPYDHLPGGIMLVPELPMGAVDVSL